MSDGNVKVNLGTIMVTCKGDGLYGVKGNVEIEMDLTLRAYWDIENGRKVWSYSKLDAAFDNNQMLAMNVVEGGRSKPSGPCSPVMPYTDSGVEECINAYLQKMGLPGRVDWSENGMQDNGLANFDADFETAKHFIPDLMNEDAANDLV